MKRTLTVSIKFQDLASERTLFQVLSKEGGGTKIKIEKYLDWLKEEYPNAINDIEAKWNHDRTKKEWNEYSDATEKKDLLSFIQRFTEDDDIVEKIKEEAKTKLENLFSINELDDDVVVKNLKTQNKDDLLNAFLTYTGDDVAYTTELYKKFYLEWLPAYIKKGLTDKNLTLDDLEKESWEQFRQKLFTDLYESWSNTNEEGEIDKLQKKLGTDVLELDGLIDTATALKTAKEKYKKERLDGKSWSLTEAEKSQLEKATNKQDLEDTVKTLMDKKDEAEQKIKDWIEKNISGKTKKEDLPSDADIDNDSELPANFKEEAKLIREEKAIELTPTPTTTMGEIKKHLTETLFKWKRWKFLVENNKKDDKSYIVALMYSQNFGKTVAEEMKPKIENAIKTDTLDGYRELDKEWGQNKVDSEGQVEYNADREYMAAWETLRELLKKTAVSKYDQIKEYLITNYFGEQRWKEIEIQAQIEVSNPN
ncbi:protein of unknown function (coil coil domain) [endosymbiont DhMRE of Dentiscutata heterogama]|uniref:hypothetical protein n=2 Tax=endosymbiont DhMRE of Dentiscutata heterogama TaxID=1609546 RepID=UPI000629D858|nr:hypothetical protein [endosymbiont DhMRE of Dentiscutata heterogama]CFW92857.1 protein of unknown function (coil coil domain) [endosymbiont DhMRE of Dentiscutata heterogama]